MHKLAFFIIVTVPGCEPSERPRPDVPPLPAVFGEVRDFETAQLVAGAHVTLYNLYEDLPVATVISQDGTFIIEQPIPESGVMIPRYVIVRHDDYLNARVTDLFGGSASLLRKATLEEFHTSVGLARAPDTGVIYAHIQLSGRVQQAVLRLAPGPGSIYYNTPPSTTADRITTQDDGDAWVLNTAAIEQSVSAAACINVASLSQVVRVTPDLFVPINLVVAEGESSCP